MRRWPLTVALLAVTVSACSSGSNRPTEADGKRPAGELRKPVATVFWQLYNSIGDTAFAASADGVFTACTGSKSSMGYTVVTTFHSQEDEGGKAATQESLAATIAERLDRAGWLLSPSHGLPRSLSKKGIKVELEPPRFTGSSASVQLKVQSKCADVGAAADGLKKDYAGGSDIYKGSRASSAPIPAGFPDSNATG